MPASELAIGARRARQTRVIGLEDLPDYPDAAQEAVDRALTALPRERIWFTYKDIRAYFGVSRATVARRLKDGLVPGVSLEGERVIEDAPVRRFDRDQLRWLLLAVRFQRRLQTKTLSH